MDMTKIATGIKAGMIAGVMVLAIPLWVGAAEPRNSIDAVKQGDATIKDAAVGYGRQAERGVEDATSPMSRDERDQMVKDKLEQTEHQQSMGQYVDDSAVTAKVKAKFLGQKGLDSLDIKVITVDGNVTLMGDVDNAAQAGLAENTAREVEGVSKVTNRLSVKK